MKHPSQLVLSLLLILNACALPGMIAPTSTPAPTNTSLPSETPSPTDTPTPEPSPTPNATGTAAMQATEGASGVMAELDKTLADSGVQYSGGHLLWQQTNAFAIRLSGPSDEVQQIGDDLRVGNFVLKADVTWVASGLIFCGVAFRSEPDVQDGKQYRFSFLRLSGLPAWAIEIYNFGQYQSSATDVRFSDLLDLQNGATNSFILVAHEEVFDIYINDGSEGRYYDFSRQRSEGAIGFLASQDSGKGSCTFENAWVWSLD